MAPSDHRVRVTKMLIRRAFTNLLQVKPIQKISIRELCEEAGINRGTFYKHYTDIYDLLQRIEDEMAEDFKEALASLWDEGQTKATPVEITTRVFQCLKDHSDICIITLGENGDKAFAYSLINLGREKCLESYSHLFAGASRKQIEFFYAFASAGCIGLLQKWLKEGMTTPAEEIAQMAEQLMMYGIGFLQREKP